MESSVQSLEVSIGTKHDLIDSNADIQMRNLTCHSVDIVGTNVVALLNDKQDILDDDTKNEVSLFKLTATNLYAGVFTF